MLKALDKKLKWDIFWVGIIQMVNYIFPFITTTYLIRTIGLENFGKIEFATLIVLYFITITNYEFHVSGTRNITRLQETPEKVNDFANAAITTKVYLFLLSLVLFAILLFIWPGRFNNWLFWSSFLIVTGHLLYQPYLFQGLGKIRVLALLNAAVKIISTILIILLIRKEDDYTGVNLNYSISYILVGIVSMVLARYYFRFRFSWQSFASVKKCLREGFYIFLTNGIVAQISLNMSAVLLGFFLAPEILGSYAAALKIVIAVHVLTHLPLKQVFFPSLSAAWVNNRADYYKKFKSYTSLLLWANLLVAAGMLIFAPYIIKVVYGDYYEKMILVMRLLSFLPLLASQTGAYISDGLIAMGKDKLVFQLQTGALLVNISLLLICVPLFGLVGVLVIRLLVDLSTLITGIVIYYRQVKLAN